MTTFPFGLSLLFCVNILLCLALVSMLSEKEAASMQMALKRLAYDVLPVEGGSNLHTYRLMTAAKSLVSKDIRTSNKPYGIQQSLHL